MDISKQRKKLAYIADRSNMVALLVMNADMKTKTEQKLIILYVKHVILFSNIIVYFNI